MAVLTEIAAGLECYNVINVLKNNVNLFKPLFCPSSIFVWDYQTISECLCAQFSEAGSNKKEIEVSVYKILMDFIECCFMDGKIIYSDLILC